MLTEGDATAVLARTRLQPGYVLYRSDCDGATEEVSFGLDELILDFGARSGISYGSATQDASISFSVQAEEADGGTSYFFPSEASPDLQVDDASLDAMLGHIQEAGSKTMDLRVSGHLTYTSGSQVVDMGPLASTTDLPEAIEFLTSWLVHWAVQQDAQLRAGKVQSLPSVYRPLTIVTIAEDLLVRFQGGDWVTDTRKRIAGSVKASFAERLEEGLLDVYLVDFIDQWAAVPGLNLGEDWKSQADKALRTSIKDIFAAAASPEEKEETLSTWEAYMDEKWTSERRAELAAAEEARLAELKAKEELKKAKRAEEAKAAEIQRSKKRAASARSSARSTTPRSSARTSGMSSSECRRVGAMNSRELKKYCKGRASCVTRTTENYVRYCPISRPRVRTSRPRTRTSGMSSSECRRVGAMNSRELKKYCKGSASCVTRTTENYVRYCP